MCSTYENSKKYGFANYMSQGDKSKMLLTYRTQENFRGKKLWRIWRITGN